MDAFIYRMEHHNVENVSVKVSKERIVVLGRVDLMGEPKTFRIDWSR